MKLYQPDIEDAFQIIKIIADIVDLGWLEDSDDMDY